MEVEIVCTKLIKPSASTPPHLRTLKLSPVDQIQYSIKPAALFYYSADGSTGSTDQEVESRRRINLLEASLSETLTRFYPLAGRYIEDGNWIDCNDEGADFFVAKVKGCRLSEVLSRRDEMIDELADLVGGAFTSPVASVQINMFECGGMVIGIRLSHHLIDGSSAACFLTSWATTAKIRQGKGIYDDDHHEVIRPTFSLTSFLPENDLPNIKPTPPLMGTDHAVTKRIVFDGAKILALRAISHDPSFPRKPSRVELVTALIWRARMRVSRLKYGDGLRSTSLAAHAMDLRPKIVPPLPPLSCGNLVNMATARFVVAESDGSKTEVPELKDLVGLVIDSLTKSKETVVTRENVFPTLLRTRNELHEAVEKGEVDVFMFTSWCNFPVYKIDFGWGKPVWVSRIQWGYEAAVFLDTEGGDGIEAWLSFNKHEMPLFLQDKDILAFTSQEIPSVF